MKVKTYHNQPYFKLDRWHNYIRVHSCYPVVIDSRQLRRYIVAHKQIGMEIHQHIEKYYFELFKSAQEEGLDSLNDYFRYHGLCMKDCFKRWEEHPTNRKWRHYFDDNEIYSMIDAHVKDIRYQSKTDRSVIFKRYVVRKRKPTVLNVRDTGEITLATGDVVKLTSPSLIPYPEYIRYIDIGFHLGQYIAHVEHHVPLKLIGPKGTNTWLIIPSTNDVLDVKVRVTEGGDVIPFLGEMWKKRQEKLKQELTKTYEHRLKYPDLPSMRWTNVTAFNPKYWKSENITKDEIKAFCQFGVVIAKIQLVFMLGKQHHFIKTPIRRMRLSNQYDISIDNCGVRNEMISRIAQHAAISGILAGF